MTDNVSHRSETLVHSTKPVVPTYNIDRGNLQGRLAVAQHAVKQLISNTASPSVRANVRRVMDDLDQVEDTLAQSAADTEVLASAHRLLSLSERMLTLLESLEPPTTG